MTSRTASSNGPGIGKSPNPASQRSGPFSVQYILEADAGEPARAAAYVAASVVGGLLAATAGYALGRKLA